MQTTTGSSAGRVAGVFAAVRAALAPGGTGRHAACAGTGVGRDRRRWAIWSTTRSSTGRNTAASAWAPCGRATAASSWPWRTRDAAFRTRKSRGCRSGFSAAMRAAGRRAWGSAWASSCQWRSFTAAGWTWPTTSQGWKRRSCCRRN